MVTICKRRGWLARLSRRADRRRGNRRCGNLLVLKLLCMGKHTATAVLRVSMQERPIAFQTDSKGGSDRDRFEIYKSTQQQLLLSRFVLLAALRNPAVAKLPIIRREQNTATPSDGCKSGSGSSFRAKES